jgi:hypothetical protein
MTLPSILLGLLISLLIGSLFHLWRGGSFTRLLFYLALSVVGFFLGQWLGTSRGWVFLSVGPLDLGVATLGSLIFLGAGYWLSLVEIRRPTGDGEDAV